MTLDGDTSTQATSESVALRVERLKTGKVSAQWPQRPVDNCAQVSIPVRVDSTGEREVVLQGSVSDGPWTPVSRSTTDFAGAALIETPGCADSSRVDFSGWRWRVVAPATPGLTEAKSRKGDITWCPAPQALAATPVTFNEFAPVTIDVTNPSSECAALATIAAEFICYQDALDGPVPPLEIGYRESTPPMYIGPGETRNFNPGEIFTDSQKQCRDYYPIFEIYALPRTVEARAQSFTAP